MNFRHRPPETPEINLIPFIDVLLVIIIFLMLTTTYNRMAALQVRLPDANAQQQDIVANKIDVIITANGTIAINGAIITSPDVSYISQLLTQTAGGNEAAVIVINADGNASHQSVINVMDAARQAGLARLTFATNTPE